MGKEKDIKLGKEAKPANTPSPTPHYFKQPCAPTAHPNLYLGKGVLTGGRDKTQIWGADVVVQLDVYSSPLADVGKGGGWVDTEGVVGKKLRYIVFPIVDHDIPSDSGAFRKLVRELIRELEDGKRVHVQCVGGHGRTGMVIGAIVGLMKPDVADPVQWVREHYCDRAIETLAQHNFVYTVTGRKIKADPSKYQKSWELKSWELEGFQSSVLGRKEVKWNDSFWRDDESVFPGDRDWGHRRWFL